MPRNGNFGPQYWNPPTKRSRWPGVALAIIASSGGLFAAYKITTNHSTHPAEAAAAAAAAPPVCPDNSVDINPGDNIQAAIDANPEGSAFCFAAGTYRITVPLAPKANQEFIGVPDQTDLNGSKVITGFVPSGAHFVATGDLPHAAVPYGECAPATPLCNYNESVYEDDQPLQRVASAAALKANTFYEDYTANKIYLGSDPSGHIIEQAVAPMIFGPGASNVTVANFMIQKAATSAQIGAVEGTGNGVTGWDIEHNEIRLNHGAGIGMTSGKAIGNHIHDNGQLGLGGTGANNVVANNEIDHNNGTGFSPQWEAGGIKFGAATNGEISDNNVHDNSGPGIWDDENGDGQVIKGNTVTNNISGIVVEIGKRVDISGNKVIGNDDITHTVGFYKSAGIVLAASPDAEVYGNRVSGDNGIGILQQNRGNDPITKKPREAYNDYIHDNTVTITNKEGSAAGADVDNGDDKVFTSNHNRFENNTYILPSPNSRSFAWANQSLTQAEWKDSGQD